MSQKAPYVVVFTPLLVAGLPSSRFQPLLRSMST
jgi:hypothetical protein